jgi:hypothetical protein
MYQGLTRPLRDFLEGPVGYKRTSCFLGCPSIRPLRGLLRMNRWRGKGCGCAATEGAPVR